MIRDSNGSDGRRHPRRKTLPEAAAERMLEQDPTADLAMAGFPSAWGKAEMLVFLDPIGDYDRVKFIKDSDVAVCLVQASYGHVPAILSARLKTSKLFAEGMKVVVREGTREVPADLLVHKFHPHEAAALFNLRSQTELNGTPCTVLRYDKESLRWLVRLDLESEDNEILVSQANLLPLWIPKADASEVDDEVRAETVSVGEVGEVEEIDDGDGQGDFPGKESRAREGSEEGEPEDAQELTEDKAKASKGKVKASHAVVVTGFPLWDSERIAEYFARFGELRTVLGADKAKNGKRKLLVAYCRKVNARRSQSHVDGAEVDGFKLHAFFPDDTSNKAQKATTRAPRSIGK